MFSEDYMGYIRSIRLQLPQEEADDYVYRIPAIRQLAATDAFPFTAPVTMFSGENGAGKSTLLEAIAIAWGFNAEGGTKNFNYATRETHSSLCRHLKIVKGIERPRDGFFLRSESYYNIATEVDNLGAAAYYGGKSLHERSHGEGFLSLITNRLGGHGLYIFDEPETALSPARQMSLLLQIHRLVKKNSQIIIATHSPMLLAYPGANIYVLSDQGIAATPYEQTEPYIIMKQFLNQTNKMLCYLFEDDTKTNGDTGQ